MMTDDRKEAGYRVVHRASRHEVWCNGTTHKHRDGGHNLPYLPGFRMNKTPWEREDYPCNCADYAPGGKLHEPINGRGSKRGRR